MTDTFYIITINFIDKNGNWDTNIGGIYLSIIDSIYYTKKWIKEFFLKTEIDSIEWSIGENDDDFASCYIFVNNDFSTEIEKIYISIEPYYLNDKIKLIF